MLLNYQNFRKLNEEAQKSKPKYMYFPNGKVEEENWHIAGKLHREDGPAVIEYHPNGQVAGKIWYVNNTNYPSSVEFWQKTPLNLEKIRELLNSDQLDYEEKAALSQNPNFEDEQDEWLFGGW